MWKSGVKRWVFGEGGLVVNDDPEEELGDGRVGSW